MYERYNFSIEKTLSFFLNEDILTFPFSPKTIIRSKNWALFTYAELATAQNISTTEISNALGSNDGYTAFNNGKYSIAYNDEIKSLERINFTLMHEIGHIYLHHLTHLADKQAFYAQIPQNESKILENEANSFARNALAPLPIIDALNLTNANDLCKVFGLSFAAAKARLAFLNFDRKYTTKPVYDAISAHFTTFLTLNSNRSVCKSCDNFLPTFFNSLCKNCTFDSISSKSTQKKHMQNTHALMNYEFSDDDIFPF